MIVLATWQILFEAQAKGMPAPEPIPIPIDHPFPEAVPPIEKAAEATVGIKNKMSPGNMRASVFISLVCHYVN
jgi:hypothetical protein